MARDWRPKKRLFQGEMIYCSPACGYKCTHAAYLEAKKNAKALLEIMKTGGWEADVSENMDWHYALRHRKLDITLHKFGKEYGLCGPTSLIGDVPHMKDPNALVRRLIRTLNKQAKHVQESLNILETR